MGIELQTPPTFLALGDSYTTGEGVDPAERWPEHLVRALRVEGIAIADPYYVARTAWTTDELLDAIDAARVTGTWSLVSMLIGVNNQYRSRKPSEFRGEFRELLKCAIRFAGGQAAHVLALSIPDWSVMPFADGRDRSRISLEIDAFNVVAREESDRARTSWVDVTPLSRTLRPGWAAPDGLHPGGVQYLAWAELALGPAKAALTAPGPYAGSRRPGVP